MGFSEGLLTQKGWSPKYKWLKLGTKRKKGDLALTKEGVSFRKNCERRLLMNSAKARHSRGRSSMFNCDSKNSRACVGGEEKKPRRQLGGRNTT